MIHVYFHRFSQAPSANRLKVLASDLPQQFHKAIFSYFKVEDQYKALVGKLMVVQALKEGGFQPELLERWETNLYGKPAIPDGPLFNISHTDGFVACAWTTQMDLVLGIDVERVQAVELALFRSSFTSQEWGVIENAPNSLRMFYHLWTKKESFIKADGRGLGLEPNQVITTGAVGMERGKAAKWYFHPLSLDKAYELHVCTSQKKTNHPMSGS